MKKILIGAGLGAAALFALSRKARSPSDLARLTLAEAQIDLALGIHEEGGYNMGEEIAKYAEPYGMSPPVAWCSLAYSTWVQRAADRLGVEPPVGSAAAQGVMQQFQEQGAWTDASEVTAAMLKPGVTVIWSREPHPNYQGHIGIIESANGLSFNTIEGNSGPAGDRVALMARNMSGYSVGGMHRVLGIGMLRPLSFSVPSAPRVLPPTDDDGDPWSLSG